MAYKRDNSGVTVLVLFIAALATAALLVHLHRMTDWSHGVSMTAAIARVGVEQNGLQP